MMELIVSHSAGLSLRSSSGRLMSYGFNAANDGFGRRSLRKINAEENFFSFFFFCGTKLNVSIFHYC